MNKVVLCTGVALTLSVSAFALEQSPIDFESENYKSLGVYDTWEESPFRKGLLQGNVQVVDNFLRDDAANSTDKILGVQRSRFGSNTFGVRIDLNTPLNTSPSQQYVHVLMHKPNDGRVMLIGLGKRSDNDTQPTDVEQFWVYPLNEVVAGQWFDAVFPVKTGRGVEIRSLVVVPDCEAPDESAPDFAVYIDEIVVDDNMSPRIGVGYYPVNFSKSEKWTRADRAIRGVSLLTGEGLQNIPVDEAEVKVYNEKLTPMFKGRAGETVTPAVDYNGNWMNSYLYIDRDNDGNFCYALDADRFPDSSAELVAYSCYRVGGTESAGVNSAGQTVPTNTLEMPSFVIPEDLTPGVYRMRYKVDWDNVDPGGNVTSQNHIIANGGAIVDVLLNVHGDYCTVYNDNRNGQVVAAADGASLNGYKAPFGKEFKVKMIPSEGFSYDGIRIRHGYNLEGDSTIKGNPQFRDDYILLDEFSVDDTCIIPADYMDGDILIEGYFVEKEKK